MVLSCAEKKRLRASVNSRCYSCNLILNDAPFRWRGRYNEDTILSLDMLHKRCCTILFYEWCMSKARTRTMKGGNTDSIYVTGTGSKSRLLARVYPQYVEVVQRYGRIHHYVNYRKHFGKLPLIAKPGAFGSQP